MQQLSRPVTSNQTGPHEKLTDQVLRHAQHRFLKPITDFNRQAFRDSLAGWDHQAPLILDAGCGVGWSTIQLARAFPDHWVIGVDQSADRIARQKTEMGEVLPDNFTCVRADLVDFWRLWEEAALPLARHYLLYQNPWPKAEHLGRRWHGHPVWPTLLSLGGTLECRSNWKIYIEELSQATNLLTGLQGHIEQWWPESFLTPFERKYHVSGQSLWRFVVPLGARQDRYRW
ncbi:tRNA (guanine-N7-)-methyltransferase [Chitinivorax tropicus]|uniref:tRNA (guanine(46)-N(7))-methyltransferase n=1 Tax=Chitinivorax tropicus TaxID=714531 RepID=A0A840MNF4_9PROT|nr:methyltransferase domain-containing protein [Chitinivorax tropicus]MBB5019960.1 tRNA (guanine-N7-)-methyltransferase [Chitinivorax tropicus]